MKSDPITSMKEQTHLRSSTPAQRTVPIPGTKFAIAIGTAAVRPYSMRVQPELLHAIGDWLSQKFDLPQAVELPRVVFVPSRKIRTLRYGNEADLFGATDVVAVYGAPNRTIYLPQGWTGSTAAELSILVHEMVHHLQNLAGMKFACSGEREKLAYQAQQEWLALFGRNLFEDFDTDAFTLLVRTACGP